MKAMILCAGLGTRLRPLTERWPKPAIPLVGAPLFRYHLAVLRRAGVTALGINTHHLPEVMEATARAECERAGLPLTVVREDGAIQGTGGGIRGLRSLLSSEDAFIVFNGDILFPVDLAPIVEAHRQARAAATMVLLPMPAGERYAAVELDPSGAVRRIAGHGPGGEGLSPWHFTGVHVMTPEVFEHMAPEGPEDINREVYVRLMERGRTLRGAVASAYWSDLGTPSRYLATQRDLLEGRAKVSGLGDPSLFAGPTGPGACWVHPAAQVDAGARVGPGCAVAKGARIEAGATLERTAVLEGTTIHAGETLLDVIAFGSQRLPA